MADLTRSISLTVPNAFVPRLQAWIEAMPPLREPSGEVDENGDPIMVEVPETVAQKFDRIAKEILVGQIKSRVRAWEIRQQQAITEITVQ